MRQRHRFPFVIDPEHFFNQRAASILQSGLRPGLADSLSIAQSLDSLGASKHIIVTCLVRKRKRVKQIAWQGNPARMAAAKRAALLVGW